MALLAVSLNAVLDPILIFGPRPRLTGGGALGIQGAGDRQRDFLWSVGFSAII